MGKDLRQLWAPWNFVTISLCILIWQTFLLDTWHERCFEYFFIIVLFNTSFVLKITITPSSHITQKIWKLIFPNQSFKDLERVWPKKDPPFHRFRQISSPHPRFSLQEVVFIIFYKLFLVKQMKAADQALNLKG